MENPIPAGSTKRLYQASQEAIRIASGVLANEKSQFVSTKALAVYRACQANQGVFRAATGVVDLSTGQISTLPTKPLISKRKFAKRSAWFRGFLEQALNQGLLLLHITATEPNRECAPKETSQRFVAARRKLAKAAERRGIIFAFVSITAPQESGHTHEHLVVACVAESRDWVAKMARESFGKGVLVQVMDECENSVEGMSRYLARHLGCGRDERLACWAYLHNIRQVSFSGVAAGASAAWDLFRTIGIPPPMISPCLRSMWRAARAGDGAAFFEACGGLGHRNKRERIRIQRELLKSEKTDVSDEVQISITFFGEELHFVSGRRVLVRGAFTNKSTKPK